MTFQKKRRQGWSVLWRLFCFRFACCTFAHTQDNPRLELTEKIEANFYSQDLTPAAPQPRQNEKPAATKISGKEILEAIRLMDADERRELTRALFA